MLAALLAATLSFHLPTHDAAEFGVCVEDTLPCTDLTAWSLWGAHQSPTWVAMRDSLLRATPSDWAALWPVVAGEAAPQRVLRNLTSAAGSLVLQVLPPGTPHRFWYVTTEDEVQNESCRSNVVWVGP